LCDGIECFTIRAEATLSQCVAGGVRKTVIVLGRPGEWYPSDLLCGEVKSDGIAAGATDRRAKGRDAAFTIDYVVGEPSGTTPMYLVPSGEEVAHALIGVIVDATEYRPVRPIEEVARPPASTIMCGIACGSW
jgi:hypothetical protein